MKHKVISLIFAASTLCVGCYKNAIERSTIVFKDSVQNVQDSLLVMQKLLSAMPKSQTPLNTNYYYQENDLYINNLNVGNPDSVLLDTVQGFVNFSDQQKKQFVLLSKYLMRNYITSGYLDDSGNLWFFEYRPLENGDFHDTREIVVLKGKDSVLIKNRSKILDRKRMVFLLAPKEAKIR